MSYVITKLPDGDVSLGNLNGEFVSLSDSISDYAPGGYAIIGGETAQQNNTPNLINCDLWRVLTAIPTGGQNGTLPAWNQTTQSIQIFTSPGVEATAGADFSKYSFQFLLVGN